MKNVTAGIISWPKQEPSKLRAEGEIPPYPDGVDQIKAPGRHTHNVGHAGRLCALSIHHSEREAFCNPEEGGARNAFNIQAASVFFPFLSFPKQHSLTYEIDLDCGELKKPSHLNCKWRVASKQVSGWGNGVRRATLGKLNRDESAELHRTELQSYTPAVPKVCVLTPWATRCPSNRTLMQVSKQRLQPAELQHLGCNPVRHIGLTQCACTGPMLLVPMQERQTQLAQELFWV